LQESGENKIVMDNWIGFLSSNRVSRLVKVIILKFYFTISFSVT